MKERITRKKVSEYKEDVIFEDMSEQSGPHSYGEDKSFLRKLNLKGPHTLSSSHERRLYAIAEQGLQVRNNIDKALADIYRYENPTTDFAKRQIILLESLRETK